MPDHFEAAGDVLEDLADVLADLAHLPAAGRAGAGRLVPGLGARQMRRQGAAAPPAPPPAAGRAGAGRLVHALGARKMPRQRPTAPLAGRVPPLLLAVGGSD